MNKKNKNKLDFGKEGSALISFLTEEMWEEFEDKKKTNKVETV